MPDRTIIEKLTQHDVSQLSEAELVSLIIKDTTDSENPLYIAKKALNDRSLYELSKLPVRRLRKVGDMGLKAATTLAAAFEIGRKVAGSESDSLERITCRKDAERIFEPMLGSLEYEEFWIVYLNTGSGILEKKCIARGSVKAVAVDLKIIIAQALELLASGILLVHNHPSGFAEPSDEDVEITDKIQRSAELFDIKVIDHLIITKGKSYSFLESGLLKDLPLPTTILQS